MRSVNTTQSNMFMKVAISTFLLLTVLYTIGCTQTELSLSEQEEMSDDIESFRVMTFNIRYDNRGDGENAWPHRKEMVAGMIRFHGADIIGLQEALLHQLEDLDELLPEFSRVGVGRDANGGGEYSAILYREHRFDLLDKRTFWLSQTPDVVGSAGWDAVLPRIATYARFQDNVTGKSFSLMNTHFDHIGEIARLKSAEFILNTIGDLAERESAIVMGDLHTTDKDEPYHVLTENEFVQGRILLDGFYHSEEPHHGPATTWTGFQEIIPDRRIDFIFASDDIRQIRHGILSDRIEGRFPSDHLPVVSDVILP